MKTFHLFGKWQVTFLHNIYINEDTKRLSELIVTLIPTIQILIGGKGIDDEILISWLIFTIQVDNGYSNSK
jgi:hypothetical protein